MPTAPHQARWLRFIAQDTSGPRPPCQGIESPLASLRLASRLLAVADRKSDVKARLQPVGARINGGEIDLPSLLMSAANHGDETTWSSLLRSYLVNRALRPPGPLPSYLASSRRFLLPARPRRRVSGRPGRFALGAGSQNGSQSADSNHAVPGNEGDRGEHIPRRACRSTPGEPPIDRLEEDSFHLTRRSVDAVSADADRPSVVRVQQSDPIQGWAGAG